MFGTRKEPGSFAASVFDVSIRARIRVCASRNLRVQFRRVVSSAIVNYEERKTNAGQWRPSRYPEKLITDPAGPERRGKLSVALEKN